MTIGQNVRQVRKLRGLTQQQLSDITGISRSYLGDLENDRRNPSTETVKKISNKLGVSLIYLLNGTPTLFDGAIIGLSKDDMDGVFSNSLVNDVLMRTSSISLENTSKYTFCALNYLFTVVDYIESNETNLGTDLMKKIIELIQTADYAITALSVIEDKNTSSEEDKHNLTQIFSDLDEMRSLLDSIKYEIDDVEERSIKLSDEKLE